MTWARSRRERVEGDSPAIQGGRPVAARARGCDRERFHERRRLGARGDHGGRLPRTRTEKLRDLRTRLKLSRESRPSPTASFANGGDGLASIGTEFRMPIVERRSGPFERMGARALMLPGGSAHSRRPTLRSPRADRIDHQARRFEY